MSAFQETSVCFRVSAVHAGGDKPTPLLCCYPGKHYSILYTHRLSFIVAAGDVKLFDVFVRDHQDPSVSAGLKNVPGVPLLYIVLNTIVLDKPSQVSLDHVQAVQLGKLISPAQQQSIHSLKEEQGISRKDGESQGKKRKRKQHHPNPLSCLKKKKKALTSPLKKTEPGEKRKRSRHKRRKTVGGDVSAPAVTNT